MQLHADHLRRALMWEPRGHADMYGCLPTAPTTSDEHFGVLFLHNEGYSTLCGHEFFIDPEDPLKHGFLLR